MNSKKSGLSKLNKLCKLMRKEILINSFNANAHHIGSELSCVEILVTLYFYEMNINKKNLNDPKRDWFILSKGHAALILYLVLEKKGFVKKGYVKKNFLRNGKNLGGHPDFKSMPGIEISSGALGNGLSIGAGVALFKKLENLDGRVFVLIGDGECNQGQIWEAIMFAAHHKLKKLIIIIDYNNYQGLDKTNKVIRIKSYKNIFKSFGLNFYEIDGHNINELTNVFKKINSSNKPIVILANTIKGKGLYKFENTLHSHYFSIENKEMLNRLIDNLK